MAELIKTRCTQGHLIITEEAIRIEGFGQRNQIMLARRSLTSIENKKVVPSVFGQGGGNNLIFHGQGSEKLEANLVNPKDAEKILSLLGYR